MDIQLIREPRGSKLGFLFWQGLYVLNQSLFKKDNWEKKLWDLIKLELFYVGGQCQHSGYCCQHRMLSDEGAPVDTYDKFKTLLGKFPIYERFFPAKAEGSQIKYFGCRCLTSDLFCSEYETRPSVCRLYPFSSFYQNDEIREGCGYNVQRTKVNPFFVSAKLKQKYQDMLQKNRL